MSDPATWISKHLPGLRIYYSFHVRYLRTHEIHGFPINTPYIDTESVVNRVMDMNVSESSGLYISVPSS